MFYAASVSSPDGGRGFFGDWQEARGHYSIEYLAKSVKCHQEPTYAETQQSVGTLRSRLVYLQPLLEWRIQAG
jgi:hypothetical protein